MKELMQKEGLPSEYELESGIRFQPLEAQPELQSIIRDVDFVTLRKVFETVGRKARISRDLNFLQPDRFYSIQKSFMVGGAWDRNLNTIGLNYEAVRGLAEWAKVDPKLRMLATLIHEEVHATSFNESRELPFGSLTKRDTTTGYFLEHRETAKDIVGQPHTSYENRYWLFNEAVTELFAQEIFFEYVQMSNFYSAEAVKRIQRAYQFEANKLTDYSEAMALVTELVKKISDVSKVDSNVVWHSIVRGLYDGPDLEDKELRKLCKGIIPSNFLNELAVAKTRSVERLKKRLSA